MYYVEQTRSPWNLNGVFGDIIFFSKKFSILCHKMIWYDNIFRNFEINSTSKPLWIKLSIKIYKLNLYQFNLNITKLKSHLIQLSKYNAL